MSKRHARIVSIFATIWSNKWWQFITQKAPFFRLVVISPIEGMLKRFCDIDGVIIITRV
jgi:hypothetical protein